MSHLIFLFALLFTIPYINRQLPFYVFTFVILLLFLVLRYDYGMDYMAYLKIHSSINSEIASWGQSDVLFKYLNIIFTNFYLLIAFVSVYYIGVIYWIVTSNFKKNEYWFPILLLLINPYLFLVHLSSLRQTIAICFVVIAVFFGIKRKIVPYCSFVLLAVGFHQSAILMFPVYFILTESKINTKVKVSIFAGLALLIATPIFDVVSRFVLNYLPVHYTYYFNQDLQNTLRSTVLSSFFFLFVILNINKLEGKKIIYGKLSLIATIIALLAFKVSMITRVGMYFDIFLIITIPQLFAVLKNKPVKTFLVVLMMVIYLLRYISFFSNDIWMQGYGVYNTILNY